MRTLAIVPVKGFGEAKRRLSDSLAPGARSCLAQAMCSDVLAALARVRAIEEVVVVTADPAAQQLAHGRARVLHDSAQAGQSAAAEIGVRHALAAGFERALMVPGDTPLLDAQEVEALLARSAARGIAIVADRHGTGTNALVLAPPDAIAPAFGPGSLERHVGLAEASGLPHRVEEAPSLAHDVDTPEDLDALRAALAGVRGRAQRTWGALHQLDNARSRAPVAAPVEVEA
ncbi:MAG TPA: 2-phospho-L-lactate guanylyltransferase [Thermoleophilaceae bacterium]